MVATSPATALKGSRQFIITGTLTTTGGANLTQFFAGHATSGLVLGRPFRLVKLTHFTDVTDASADSTLVITAYKGSVAAGNRALETTPVLTAIAQVTNKAAADETTVVNAGMDSFTATDGLVFRALYTFAADAAIFRANFTLIGEWEI